MDDVKESSQEEPQRAEAPVSKSRRQHSRQRMYRGPPPGWEGPPPPHGSEVFVGKIPRDMYEDDLVPLFKRAGRLYEFRLMMEFSGENRGYAFVMYTNREAAQTAIQMFDNHEIRPGRFLGVCMSRKNCRLFISSIPKDKPKEEIMEEMKTVTDGVVDVIVENRGFALIEYETHKAAAMAWRKLIPGNSSVDEHTFCYMLGNFQLWGQSIQVSWAIRKKDAEKKPNCRLFISSIPKDKTKEEIMEEMKMVTDGVVDVIVENRGFALIEYGTHKAAAMARKKLIPGNIQLWDQSIQVNWAMPDKDADNEVMQCVRVLYVHNLMLSTTEETIHLEFSRFKPGCVERVKKVTNYAFVHYCCHNDAMTALSLMNGAQIDGVSVEVMLAKPPGFKDRGVTRKRYLGNNKGGGGGMMGNGYFSPWSPFYTGAVEDLDRCVVPLIPGTPFSPTSLQALDQSQISWGVSLLELFCHKTFWSPENTNLS